jgi:hypothetical protein
MLFVEVDVWNGEGYLSCILGLSVVAASSRLPAIMGISVEELPEGRYCSEVRSGCARRSPGDTKLIYTVTQTIDLNRRHWAVSSTVAQSQWSMRQYV